MERKRSSMRKRLSGSTGDLHLGCEGRRTLSFPHRRVNFSHMPQVREFDASLSPASVGFGSREWLVQGDASQIADANRMSPYVNQANRTNQNQLDDFDSPEGSGRHMSVSMQHIPRDDYHFSSNGLIENRGFEECHDEELPSTSRASTQTRDLPDSPPTTFNLDIRVENIPASQLDSEFFGLDKTMCSLNFSMSLCLENVSGASQQSRERTNSLVRDMSSVQELSSLGNSDTGDVPEASSQALGIMEQSQNKSNLPMSLSSLANESVASHQSQERTNSSIRDMSSVEELRTVGHCNPRDLPGTSTQAFAIFKPSPCTSNPTVTVRNTEVLRQHDENPRRSPMVFKPPNLEDFLNPFGAMKRSFQPKEPQNKLSFGKFGALKTPKRNMIASSLPPRPQQNQKVIMTNDNIEQSSPMLPAPLLSKTTNDVGLNCTLGTRDSRPENDEPKSPSPATGSSTSDTLSKLVKAPTPFVVDACENEVDGDCEGSYSHSDLSSSISDLSTHNEEEPSSRTLGARDSRPATASHEPVLPDTTGSVNVETPSNSPIVSSRENDVEGDCEGSYSHSDMSSSILAVSTHDEEGSSEHSSLSSPPSRVSESEDLFEDSIEFNGEDDRGIEQIASNSSSDSVHTIMSDKDEGDSRDSALHEDEMNEEGHEGENQDGGTGETLGERLEESLVEEEDVDEEEDGEEEDEDGEEGEQGEIGVDEEDNIDEVGVKKNEGEMGTEVEVRNDVSQSEFNPVLQNTVINLLSSSLNQSQPNTSHFFEKSLWSQESVRIENEGGLSDDEGNTPATVSMRSDSTVSSQRDQTLLVPLVDQINENHEADGGNEVYLHASVSEFSGFGNEVFKDLLEKLSAYSVDSDLDIFTKWGFLRSVEDKLSRLTRPEWEALLQFGRIKEFMGDNYVKTVEIRRERFLNQEPLYRCAVNLSRPDFFPEWARIKSNPNNRT